MTQVVAQTFGMTFVGIIVICLVITIVNYIFEKGSTDTNKKLLDNMKKMDEKLNKKYK